MTTITTVGYGDMYPVTDFGRFLAMVCMVLGILAMAMPITVLGSNFQTQFHEQNMREFMSNTDIFRSLEIGIVEQKGAIPPENSVGNSLSEAEHDKLLKAKQLLSEESGISDADAERIESVAKKSWHYIHSCDPFSR